jgi:hypothetical protein
MTVDIISKGFWAEWVAAYLKGDELKCHSLVANTLIGKDGGPRVGMATLANSYFEDLADYLTADLADSITRKRKAKK